MGTWVWGCGCGCEHMFWGVGVCLSVGECVWMATRLKLLEQEKIMRTNAVYEG